MSEPLGILLLSGGHERAHYAMMTASCAAALGREVILFATNEGCIALMADWRGMADARRDASVRAAGVASFDELREACIELGVRMIACEAGLAIAGLDRAGLLPQVTVAGIASFLAHSRGGQLLSL